MRAMGGLQERAFRARGLAAATGDVEAYSRALNRIRWERVSAGGRILQHTARVAEYAGLVLGGSLAVMANNAAKFDTSVTLAATQTRRIGGSFKETAANSKILQQDIRNLMTQFPQSAEDFSKAAYDIYSSTNVSFGGGRKLLKLFAQAAVAGQTDVQTATNAGITVMNNFGNSTVGMKKKLDTAFAAVRFGRITFDEFAKSMATIAPAARAGNQSFEEMAGTFAFLTRHLDVSKARVGFARVIEALATPKMIAGLKKVGISVQDANKHLLPLDQIIGKIVTKFPHLRSGGTDALNFFKNIGGLQSTIQARRAFTFLVQFYDRAGKDGRSYRQFLRDVKTDQGEFQASLQAMERTTGVRWGTFVNQIKALALAFGADLVPALLKLSGPIQDVVRWWEKLSDSTRASIARFTTYTAAFLLVGGAVTFLAGTFMKLFASIGKFAGLGGAMTATLFGVAAAVTLLTGNLHSLSSIIDTIANYTFSSWTGFATVMGVAAVGALRLTSALKGLAAANAVSGAAGGGGLLAGLVGGARNARAGTSLAAEAVRSKGLIAGLAASAALLPPAFLPTVGIVAAIGAGLFAWHKHLQGVKRDAEDVQKSFDIGAASRLQGDIFQQIVGSTEGVTRAQINVRNIQRSIRELKKELKGTKGDARSQILDNIKLQELDLVHAQNDVTEAVRKNNIQFRALSQSFAALGPAQQHINRLRQQLQQLQDVQRRAPMTPGIAGSIELAQKRLQTVIRQTRASAEGLPRIFDNVVRGLAKIGEIKMPSATGLKDLFNIARQKGRMLTIPEIKAVLRVEADPSSIRTLPTKLQRQLRTAIKVRVEAKADRAAVNQGFKAIQGILGGKTNKVNVTAVAHTDRAKRAFQALRTPITKTVNLKTSQDPESFGHDISAGIEAGLYPIHQQVIQDVIQNPITKKLGIHSPSQWAKDKVGKPIVEGIALGILGQKGTIEKAATASITFFESAAIQKAQEAKKKITNALLIGDISLQAKTLTQFNNAIAKLGRRRVPRELIDQLAALGPDQAKFISQIANMSEKELRRYVRAWQRANAQVKRSMRATMDDIKSSVKDAIQQGVDNLQNMFQQISDTQTQNFGGIFDGLDAKVGDGFQQAMDEYNSQMADFQGQIKDLNQQLVDAQAEAQQRLVDAINARKDELQQAMGALFSGDWLTGPQVQTKLDWGAKLGFDDLQKDLESQVDKFKRWRDDLTSLAGKVPPELAKQLEALGPDAVDKLDVLNNATGDQLQQYVATWQDGQNQIQAVANKTTVDTSDITARVNDILTQIDVVTQKMSQIKMPTELTGQDIINNLQAQQDQWIEYQNILQALIDKGIPMGLVEQLQEMGPAALPYMKALNSMTDTQLQQLATLWDENHKLIYEASVKALNTQLQLWYNYGVNIARNIISGIQSQGDYLKDYFEALIRSMLEGMGPPAAPPPPNPNNPTPPYPVGAATTGSTGTSGGGGARSSGVNTPTTQINLHDGAITVVAHQDESLDDALSRAAFRATTKVTG